MKKSLKFILVITLTIISLGCEQTTTKTSEDKPKDGLKKEIVDNTQKTVLIGQFVDAPVKGCKYKTSSNSGVTNDKGEFKYLEGESVDFFIGDFKLGSVKGKKIITPLGLVKGEEPSDKKTAIISLSSEEKSKVNVMLQLLQSVDKDGNSSNGIDLSDAVDKTFPELNETVLSDESELAKVVEAITPGKPVVDVEEALKHFKNQLEIVDDASETNTSETNTSTVEEEDYKLINPVYENKLSGTWSVSIEDNDTKEFLLEDENLSAQFVPINKDELLSSGYLYDIGNMLDDVNVTSVVSNDDSIKYTINIPISNALSSPLNGIGSPNPSKTYIVKFKILSRYEKAYINREDVLNRSIYRSSYDFIHIRNCTNSGVKSGVSVEAHKSVNLFDTKKFKVTYEALKKRALNEDGLTLSVEGLVSPDLRMPYMKSVKISTFIDDEQCHQYKKIVNVWSLFRYDHFSTRVLQAKQGISLSGTWSLKYRTKIYGNPYSREQKMILAADVPLDLTSLSTYTHVKDGFYYIPQHGVKFSSDKVEWSVLTYFPSKTNPGRLDTTVIELVFSKEP